MTKDPAKRREQARRNYLKHREARLAYGRDHYWANREKNRVRAAIYYRKNAERCRLRPYGLSETEYQEMVSRQKGCCALCEKPLTTVHIDHDHSSGLVRSLLCPRCNMLVGFIETSPELVEKAQKYSRSYQRSVA